MTVLLTGAGGFLGIATASALRRRGIPLVAHLGPENTPRPPLLLDEDCFTADITNPTAFRTHLKGVDVLIHLAGPPSVAESFRDPITSIEAHMVGTANVLQAAAQTNVRHVVYISSAEVYGQPETSVVKEESPLQPRSPYGAAKLGAEGLIRSFTTAGHFTATILRPFSVYGPRAVQPGVLGVITNQLHQTKIQLQSPDSVRDFCYIDDVAEAIVMAALEDSPNPLSLYNVGSGVGTSIATVTTLLLQTIGREHVPIQKVLADRPAKADIQTLIADTALIQSKLGWTAQTPIHVGLQNIVEVKI